MRQYYFKTFLAVSILISGLSLKGQQQFDSALSKLGSQYPQEKIYMQFDKALYNPGEKIWFKAYIFADGFPSLISKTLYTELVDEKGNIIQRLITPVIFSGSAAQFDLPLSLASPVVYIRAYTKWMLNFDSSFFYTRAIAVAAPANKAAKKIVQPLQYSLQFFPEGGDMIKQVEQRIAFKATDSKGLPVPVKGDIVNSKGIKVNAFKSVHDGMGYFNLKPLPNETYKATWKDEHNINHQTILPQAKENGVVLQLNNEEGKIHFTIKRTLDTSYNSVYVVAQMQQQLLYRAKANLSKSDSIDGAIPSENLIDGIVQVTVFSNDRKPLAERIIFINKQNYYFITDLNSAQKDIGKRKKNAIQIDVPDTIKCNLSVAVTDAEINPADKSQDIFSDVLLTTDIKGYVHNPACYFSSDADSVAKNLDLVMMTNGWRRFRWQEVLAGKFPKINYLPENFLEIHGKTYGLSKTEMAGKELNGILELKKGNRQFLTIPLMPDGNFSIPGMIFYDTAKLYYQFNNDKNKLLTSKATFEVKTDLLNKPPVIQPDSFLLARLTKPDTILLAKNKKIYEDLKAQDRDSKVKVLTTVVIKAKQKSKEEKMNEEYSSGLFTGGDGYTFITEDDPFAQSSLSVLNYLQGKVAGLQITMGGAEPSLSWRGGTPSLYLNEMQADASQIQTLSMSDVAMIKVFRPPFFGGGSGGSGGAIAVYLKKGSSGRGNVTGLDFASIPGYTPIKEFYSPDYSHVNDQNEQPDIRTTLYWNPFIITDKTHRRIVLPFYNNDVTKKYRVIIEGINEDGKLTRVEKVFE